MLRDWQNFYILTGTSAATLIGLMFIAISLGASVTEEDHTTNIQTFVNPTLVHFVFVLVIAIIGVVPTNSTVSMGILLMAIGIAGVCWPIFATRRLLFVIDRRHLDTGHLIWHGLLPLVAYILVILAGIGLVSGTIDALDLLAGASLLLLVAAIRNAWILMLWLAQHRKA